MLSLLIFMINFAHFFNYILCVCGGNNENGIVFKFFVLTPPLGSVA